MRAADRQRAMLSGESKYFGKVCAEHPHLNGEKYVSGGCVQCTKTKSIVKRRLERTGMSDAMFRFFWDKQGGLCPVCRCDLSENKACADHCHETNTPRGLLCDWCNRIEGMIKHRGISAAEFGQRLSTYLKEGADVRSIEEKAN